MTKDLDGIVDSFNIGESPWWGLKLMEHEVMLVHNNRVKELGTINEGDRVKVKVAEHGPYSNSKDTFVQKLERV